MAPIRILVDSFADAGLPNAQMGNAREIITRLDPDLFHVSLFALGEPDSRIAARRNTRLIKLPDRRQTPRILSEFLFGSHALLFYIKSSPASRWYLSLRKKWRDRRVAIGTVESQCDFHHLPDVSQEAVDLWTQTVLRCDRLYSNCEFVRRSLEHEYGAPSEIIPTGADTRFFTPRHDRPGNPRLRVLFAGSLCRRKHPEVLLSAAARFPQVDFRIVGEGPLHGELRTRIGQERLGNVTLAGCLGPEQLREEYRQADIFFFPSTFEGSPKVIVEAAACGLPVIVRDSYSPDTVIHGVSGFHSASNEEMFSFLKLLLENPVLRRQFGEAGRKHSVQFDWDQIANQWATTFAALAQPQLRSAS
ncbi:MAG TPA: glycosyltransferase family 4 protein [Terriglobales bacterium]